jgi:hypothetical protein
MIPYGEGVAMVGKRSTKAHRRILIRCTTNYNNGSGEPTIPPFQALDRAKFDLTEVKPTTVGR